MDHPLQLGVPRDGHLFKKHYYEFYYNSNTVLGIGDMRYKVSALNTDLWGWGGGMKASVGVGQYLYAERKRGGGEGEGWGVM